MKALPIIGELSMENFRHNGKVITATLGSVDLSGEPVAIGIKAGVPPGDYAAGVEGEYVMGGVFSFASEAGITQGAQVGWDISAKQVVDDADVNKDFDLGYCTKAEAGGIVEVMVNGQSY